MSHNTAVHAAIQAMAALDAWAITWAGEGSAGIPYLEALLGVRNSGLDFD